MFTLQLKAAQATSESAEDVDMQDAAAPAAAGSSKAKGKGKAAGPKLKFNFDTSDDDQAISGHNGVDNNAGPSTREESARQRLYELYWGTCALHPKQYCMLVGLVHVIFSFQMIRYWAIAEVRM